MKEMASENPNWVITDNTLLTDASIIFKGLQNPNSIHNPDRFENWKRFLEGVILHERMFADDHIFRHQEHIKYLQQRMDSYIAGVNISDEERGLILKDASRAYKKVYDVIPSIFGDATQKRADYQKWINRTSHDLQRSLFYISLSEKLGLSYRPSISRERVFNKTYEKKPKSEINADAVSSAVMQKLFENASIYAENIKRLGGPQLIIATLPPITNMVIHTAKKTGSWSDAIELLRGSQSVRAFQNWCNDVADSIQNGNARAIKKLRTLSTFLEGWRVDPDEGVYHSAVKIGISSLPKIPVLPMIEMPELEISKELSFELPVLWRPYHLLFLNQVYKTTIQPEIDLSSLSKIKL